MASALTDSFTDSDSAIAEKESFAFMVFVLSSGQNVGGKVRAILGARVGGMDAERVESAARMLPDAAPLIPVEAQSPKHTGQTGFASG